MNENEALALPLVVRESHGLYRSKILIGHTRTCSRPPNHMNCLTAKEWIKCQLGVWQFVYEGRDIRGKNVHPATFPIALSKRVISLFTHEGELVLDPFVGSGTTLVAARDLNRNAAGFDLQPQYINLCEKRLPEQTNLLNHSRRIAIEDDARNITRYLRPHTVSLECLIFLRTHSGIFILHP